MTAVAPSRLEHEIREQPAALRAALERNAEPIADIARAVRARGPIEQVAIVARGTSDNAARYAQYLFGARLGVPVALAAPSLTTRYGAPVVPRGARGLVAALVASLGDGDAPTGALAGMPELVDRTVEAAFAAVPALDEHASARHLVAVGRGFNYATAMEAALKVRELTGIVGEGFSPPDLLHGPIAAVAPGTPVLVVAPTGRVRASVIEAAAVLRARGAACLRIDDHPGAELPLPGGVEEWLSPIAAIVPGQVLALRWAQLRGQAVDTPPGLTKVTETL